jgi:hypothetical protein
VNDISHLAFYSFTDLCQLLYKFSLQEFIVRFRDNFIFSSTVKVETSRFSEMLLPDNIVASKEISILI